MASKANQPLRARVERGIYKRKTKTGETKYEVFYIDSNGSQRWRTVERLQEARDLRAESVSKVKSGERGPRHGSPSARTSVATKAGVIRVRHQLDRGRRRKREIPVPPSLGRVLADAEGEGVREEAGEADRLRVRFGDGPGRCTAGT